MRWKQRETRFFIQNTLPEVQFRDSQFAAEISVNPCETATKGTKKLLAIVSTFASREFILVEVRGVEPLCRRNQVLTSTYLVRLMFVYRLLGYRRTDPLADYSLLISRLLPE